MNAFTSDSELITLYLPLKPETPPPPINVLKAILLRRFEARRAKDWFPLIEPERLIIASTALLVFPVPNAWFKLLFLLFFLLLGVALESLIELVDITEPKLICLELLSDPLFIFYFFSSQSSSSASILSSWFFSSSSDSIELWVNSSSYSSTSTIYLSLLGSLLPFNA